jgi:3-deoxy-D-manno-octulosonic-acid transferase
MRDVETTSFPDFNVLILDTIGQLASAYDLASMAYIGGGFNKGIHNTLEPAVFGIPVFFGPRYHKFNEAIDFIELGVAKSVESTNQLEAAFQHFNTTEQLEKTETLLNGYFNAKKGATQKIMTHLNTFLEQ